MMAIDSIERAATALYKARRGRYQIEDIPLPDRPSTVDDAYAIQQRLYEMLGGRRSGFFLGGTNATPTLPFPYYAPILAGQLRDSGVQLGASEFLSWEIDVEYGFTFRRTVIPRQETFEIDEVVQLIDTIHPAFDVVNCHFKQFDAVEWPSVIADLGVDGAIVRGPGSTNWSVESLARSEARLFVNGRLIEIGAARRVMESPVNALHWFVNHCSRNGITVEAGEFVSTGSCTSIFYGKVGDTLLADFGPLGTVEAHLTP
jgi:2-keto-4-pentenoate hydratase